MDSCIAPLAPAEVTALNAPPAATARLGKPSMFYLIAFPDNGYFAENREHGVTGGGEPERQTSKCPPRRSWISTPWLRANVDVISGDASFSLVDLQEVLCEAAQGRVRSQDPEDRMNHDSWAVALAAHVARVHGAPALRGAVQELLASADLRAVRLGRAIHAVTTVLENPAPWALLLAHLQAGRVDHAREVIEVISGLDSSSNPNFPQGARDLLADRSTPLAIANVLSVLAARADGAWLLQNPAVLVAIDPERVLYAATLPTAAQVQDFVSQLRESLRAHGRPPLSDATERRLDAMIVARRAAGGDHGAWHPGAPAAPVPAQGLLGVSPMVKT